jgi:hypothetical protein
MSEYSVKDYGNITDIKVYGLDESIKRAKYPMSVDTSIPNSDITKGILGLSNCEKGTGHDQWLTGVIVQFDLTYTIKAWTEAERYNWLNFISSQSTMHRIAKFEIDKQCCQYVTPATIAEVNRLKAIYEADPTPDNYLYLLYNTPVGFKLTAGMTTNYRQLKTIYAQRKTHRLPEWREFCEWIETLPRFKELCLKGGDSNE